MEIKHYHITAIIISVLIIAFDIYRFYGTPWLMPLFVVGAFLGGLPFLIDFLRENKKQKEIETKFLEFVRALVENVKSGIPIPRAILQISDEDYGALTPHVKKLANQLEWGFPLREALEIFANDTRNSVIRRAISIVMEAERSGGNMTEVLEAVTNSVYSIKKIKEERRSTTFSQIIQGYIIFFVFIIIMLVLQIYLIPKISTLGTEVTTGGGLGASPLGVSFGAGTQTFKFETIFTWLVIIQGFFAGLMIGKFSEGELKAGIKHSVALVVIGYLIISTVTAFVAK